MKTEPTMFPFNDRPPLRFMGTFRKDSVYTTEVEDGTVYLLNLDLLDLELDPDTGQTVGSYLANQPPLNGSDEPY